MSKEMKGDWHAEDIKAAIRKRGKTLSNLSREHGLASDTLRNALRHHWPKGENIIAAEIGLTPADVWPSRYESKLRAFA